MDNDIWPKNSLFKRILGWVVLKFFPMHGRRAVYLTTLCMHIGQCSGQKRTDISRINRLVHIVNNDDALDAPMLLYGSIWRKSNQSMLFVPPVEVLTFEQLDELARQAMECAKTWACYQEEEIVLSETRYAFLATLKEQDRISQQNYQNLHERVLTCTPSLDQRKKLGFLS